MVWAVVVAVRWNRWIAEQCFWVQVSLWAEASVMILYAVWQDGETTNRRREQQWQHQEQLPTPPMPQPWPTRSTDRGGALAATNLLPSQHPQSFESPHASRIDSQMSAPRCAAWSQAHLWESPCTGPRRAQWLSFDHQSYAMSNSLLCRIQPIVMGRFRSAPFYLCIHDAGGGPPRSPRFYQAPSMAERGKAVASVRLFGGVVKQTTANPTRRVHSP